MLGTSLLLSAMSDVTDKNLCRVKSVFPDHRYTFKVDMNSEEGSLLQLVLDVINVNKF